MSVEKNIRNSYADLGLIVAVTILIVTIIKCLVFGIAWESLFWLVLSIAYCALSYKVDSHSKTIKHSTTGFLLLSVIAAVTMTIVDRKPQPKMHAFESAVKDTVAEEEFILKKEPELPELKKDSIVVIKDTNTIVQPSDTEDETPSAEESTETTDIEEEIL